MMNNVPREKLVELVARYGHALAEEPRRCEALLRDYCGQFRREISALVNVVEEHAAADMLAPHAGTPREVLLARLAQRLCDHLALSEEAAQWAVDSWALALGLVTSAELEARAQKSLKHVEAAPPKLVADGTQTKQSPGQTAEATNAVIISRDGGGDFQTIGDGMRAARPGTRLLIRPGLYNEGIRIDKQVEIVGDGSVEDIIIRSVNSSCIEMRVEHASVRGLTLRGRAGRAGKAFFAVDIARGQLRLEACDITSDSLSCVAIHGAAANPSIRRCRIRDAADSGIYVFDRAAALVEECDIYRSANVGVAITQGAKPLIKRCRIFEGKNAGVVVWGSGAGAIEDCEVFANTLSGVGISEHGNPTVRRCSIYAGKNSGLFIHKNGMGVIEDCDIHGNDEAEVAITEGSNTVLRRCSIHRGKTSGVIVRDQSRALLERCAVYGNADAGVTIHGGSVVALRQCNINRNVKVAVRVVESSAANVENCDLTGNLLAAWETEYGVVVERRNNIE